MLKLTAPGKRALAHVKTLELTAKLAFMPISGESVTATKKFTLRRGSRNTGKDQSGARLGAPEPH
jgi:hypothetical protein